MANNQNVNKVVYDGTTLIDLTGDDVTAGDVLSGKKFHLPSGAEATGTMPNMGAISGILKGDGQGGVTAATAGTDYGTYSKPSTGIPKTDLASGVQTSLGLADNAKPKQTAVSDPSADGTGVTFIATISQNENGVIIPTKQTVRDVTTSVNGLMIASDKVKLDYIGVGSNAGFHNSIYRGKNLGSSVTAAQYAAISSGKFDDLFIGDYWTINNVNWRIAAFDYWLRTGDKNWNDGSGNYTVSYESTHHIVIVPDTNLYNAQMHNTESGAYTEGAANNPTTGAYIGSDMYTTNLARAKTIVNDAFGAAHVLNHREHLQNAATNGYSTGGSWYDSTVDLMNEQMVYGCRVFGNVLNGTNWPNIYTNSTSQLPLFALEPSWIFNRTNFWLRDVASSAVFANVTSYGYAAADYSSAPFGVRPAFGIKA